MRKRWGIQAHDWRRKRRFVRTASRSWLRSAVQRVEWSCESTSGSVGSGTGGRVVGVRQLKSVWIPLRMASCLRVAPFPRLRSARPGPRTTRSVSARTILSGSALALLGLVTKSPSQIDFPSLSPTRSSRWYESLHRVRPVSHGRRTRTKLASS